MRERSAQRVLTTEWADGMRWDDFLEDAEWSVRQRAAEVLFRFAQGSINRHGVFNGDPHPGNYRFHPDGSVTFLDFGLVKRWTHGELDSLAPVMDALLERDAEGTARNMVEAGFLAEDHGLDPKMVWEYVSGPYVPFCMMKRWQSWYSGMSVMGSDRSAPLPNAVAYVASA